MVDPVVHLRLDGRENRLVASDLVRHEHSPDGILAVPEVPVGEPAHLLHAGVRVADADQVLVGVAAKIAVRVLVLHEAVALLADEGKELPVTEIFGDAGGRKHLLSPELAAPEASDLGHVVVAELERLPRLVEYLLAHEGIDKAAGYEAVHLRAKPALELHVP